MDKERLKYASIDGLLITGPVGNLAIRMLERLNHPRYRYYDRLAGGSRSETAIGSLRAAAAAMTPAEQGLFMLGVIFTPWIGISRATGLTIKMCDILDALVEEIGKPICLVAAKSVIDRGEAAVRRYPIEGLFPENRKPGEGLVFRFSPEQCRDLGITESRIEVDRLVSVVNGFDNYGWEANLRPLTTWWLANTDKSKADSEVDRLLAKLSEARLDERTQYRALGLLDWLTDHPNHPRAHDAVKAAARISHAPLRKSVAKLAAAMKTWDVIESLARNDPDKGVRKLAEELLASKGGSETTPDSGAAQS